MVPAAAATSSSAGASPDGALRRPAAALLRLLVVFRLPLWEPALPRPLKVAASRAAESPDAAHRVSSQFIFGVSVLHYLAAVSSAGGGCWGHGGEEGVAPRSATCCFTACRRSGLLRLCMALVGPCGPNGELRRYFTSPGSGSSASPRFRVCRRNSRWWLEFPGGGYRCQTEHVCSLLDPGRDHCIGPGGGGEGRSDTTYLRGVSPPQPPPSPASHSVASKLQRRHRAMKEPALPRQPTTLPPSRPAPPSESMHRMSRQDINLSSFRSQSCTILQSSRPPRPVWGGRAGCPGRWGPTTTLCYVLLHRLPSLRPAEASHGVRAAPAAGPGGTEPFPKVALRFRVSRWRLLLSN